MIYAILPYSFTNNISYVNIRNKKQRTKYDIIGHMNLPASIQL